jgi:hypothetical protein
MKNNFLLRLGPYRAVAFFPGFENEAAGKKQTENEYKD